MREWNLKSGDPLELTLAADARFGPTEYCDDQIWVLRLGGGDPPAVAFQTTYGLRARSMRLFPRFIEADRELSDPAEFVIPPSVQQFYPNYLQLQCSPFTDIDISLEYRVPQSRAVAGRIVLHNSGTTSRLIQVSWVAQLTPTEGQRMAPLELHSAPSLAGQTDGLAPVVFLTGGPQAVSSPYPALNLEVELPAGATRRFTWSHAALAAAADSFTLARKTAACAWEAEVARVELLNASQIEVFSGNSDWDAAFALSQKLAYTAFVGPTEHLPRPSFVLSRQPDQGYSMRCDGSDYNHLWNGQSPLETYYLASLLLPGAGDLLQGLILNFIASRSDEGMLDWKPGLGGQRSHLLAMPILARLAWKLYQTYEDKSFLQSVFQPLIQFVNIWFTPRHDRDGDGVPEWDNPTQAGFEDHPDFSRWQEWAQGVDISAVESPALGTMLLSECESLFKIASELGRIDATSGLQAHADHLRQSLETAWDERNKSYVYLDRDSHLCTQGELLGERSGSGDIGVQRIFEQPIRLLVRVTSDSEATTHPELIIYGDSASGQRRVERITQDQFRWFAGQGIYTGERVYTRIKRITVVGVSNHEHIAVSTVDVTRLDHTLLLPLWAKIPDTKRADSLVKRSIVSSRRYGRAFGLPACPVRVKDPARAACSKVHLPWNLLIAEGLLAYDYREEAAELLKRLMSAIIQNLKQNQAFSQAYHADSGEGLAERNTLSGLAPLGLFMDILGVRIHTAKKVFLTGFNPFPWPVTVKYRGLTILRRKDSSVVTFQDGQTATIEDPSPQIVSLE